VPGSCLAAGNVLTLQPNQTAENSGERATVHPSPLRANETQSRTLVTTPVRAPAMLARMVRILDRRQEEFHMLWALVIILLLLWLGGFSLSIAGSLIHLLLVIAVVIAIYNLVVTRGHSV
jgi:hypothetical protein